MKLFSTLVLCLFTFTMTAQFSTPMGTPGPDYWQNRADYTINARLDTNLHLVTGRVAITYYNNSPYELDFLWLQLEQNKYREDARGTRVSASGSRHDGNITEGMPLGTVTVNGAPATYQVDDTRLKIDLKVPVPPKNGKVELAMDYSFTIPEKGADRMGRIRIDSSWVYTIAQWYPRMAVLDPGQGWNNLPYLGAGEFYADYGTYDYTITVPSNMVVAGSGVLQNAREVLPKEVSDRLKTAASSDSTQWIIRPEEAGAFRFGNRASASWRFKMENTRDVAWACSSHFLWDAAPARLPSGRKVTTQSYYPPASLDGWTRATEYAIASLEHYSEMWYEYPYSTLSNVAGTVGGMEYPGLHFTEYNRSGNRLWVTLDHEVAHNWFPMIVGSNERQHAWMDESFVTFMGFYAARAFEGADYTSYISNHQNMLERFGDADFVPVMTPPRDIPNGFSDVVYFKPAIALRVLREYVLGPSRFDPAFKHYIKSWAYKHPQPEDFFRCMENASGDQLGWFWQSWFYKNEKLDQEITSATQRAEGELNILLKNRLDMPMPVVLQLTFEDGTTTHHRLPVEIWNQGNTHRLQLNYEKRVASLMIDPDHWLPDLERRNNRWDFDRQ